MVSSHVGKKILPFQEAEDRVCYAGNDLLNRQGRATNHTDPSPAWRIFA